MARVNSVIFVLFYFIISYPIVKISLIALKNILLKVNKYTESSFIFIYIILGAFIYMALISWSAFPYIFTFEDNIHGY